MDPELPVQNISTCPCRFTWTMRAVLQFQLPAFFSRPNAYNVRLDLIMLDQDTS